MMIDVHCHHPAFRNEKVLQQDVHILGIHPWNVTYENIDILINEYDNKLMNNMFIGIGECGLDKLCKSPMEAQKKVFIHQIMCSEKFRLPLILHCVKAVDEVLAIKKEIKPQQPWIFHGFRGKAPQLLQLINNGFYISFGVHYNVDALKMCPLNRIFLETDDKNIFVGKVYEQVSKDLYISVGELEGIISNNAQFFTF